MSVQNCLVPPWERPSASGLVPLDTVQSVGGSKTFTASPAYQSGLVDNPTGDQMVTFGFCGNFNAPFNPPNKSLQVNDDSITYFSLQGLTPGFYVFQGPVTIENTSFPLADYTFSYSCGSNILGSFVANKTCVNNVETMITGVFQVTSTLQIITFNISSFVPGNLGTTTYNFGEFNIFQL